MTGQVLINQHRVDLMAIRSIICAFTSCYVHWKVRICCTTMWTWLRSVFSPLQANSRVSNDKDYSAYGTCQHCYTLTASAWVINEAYQNGYAQVCVFRVNVTAQSVSN